jgi:hypothetical protein
MSGTGRSKGNSWKFSEAFQYSIMLDIYRLLGKQGIGP